MKQADRKVISSIRDIFWPIYGREHRIYLPMATMIGLILFNYTILRNLKDGLVVTATGSSEVITFLKFCAVLPGAVAFFFIYSKLSNLMSKRKLFYVVVGPFLLFFLTFAFVLYPMRDVIHPSISADYLQSWLPSGARGLVDCYRYWSFSLFYVMSELWGAVVSALLFWQFANDVIKVSDAKRYYPHFYLLANCFTMLSGFVVKAVTKYQADIPHEQVWGITIQKLSLIICLAGAVVIAIYFLLDRFVFTESHIRSDEDLGAMVRKAKPKMSLYESIKFLLSSRYLGLICLLVIGYGVSINFVEVTWKNQLGQAFADGAAYTGFMGNLSIINSILTIIAIFTGSVIVRRLGWKTAALFTPVVILATGALFFTCVLFPSLVSPLEGIFGAGPLILGVWIGLIQNVSSKSIKYAMFDPTKEMAYIPLDDESKTKGKAAIDVVANRLGKSGGAFLQMLLIIACGSVGQIAPIVAVLMVLVCIVWILAVCALNEKFLSRAKHIA